MKITYIYALLDPRYESYRYIGKADNPRLRLQRHLQPCRLKDDTHKNDWLRSILGIGLLPEMRILACVEDTKWADAERHWIAYFTAHREDLTNGTIGGDGASFPGKLNPMYGRCGPSHPCFGKSRPKDVMRRIGLAQKGIPKKVSPEGREAMSARSKTLIGPKNPFYGKKHSEETKRAWSKKRSKLFLEVGRISKSISEWSLESGINPGVIRARIRHGWNSQDAIFKPLQK